VKLCHSSGGELEQIQFLLGHASVQTTERYLGCKQNLGHPVNDLFDLKVEVQPQEMSSESATVKGPGADILDTGRLLGSNLPHGGFGANFVLADGLATRCDTIRPHDYMLRLRGVMF